MQVLAKMTLPEPSPLPVDPASIRTEMWAPGRTKFVLEPMFVPRRGAGATAAEDDGYLLMLVHDGATGGTELAVLDARSVSKGAAKPHGDCVFWLRCRGTTRTRGCAGWFVGTCAHRVADCK